MRAEEAKLTGRLCQIEERIRPKLESILSPVLGMENMELADIIDVQAIQSLMDDFYKFAHITMALVDLKGNVLVSIGWQDICTGFHRAHPETCKHCIESDTKLSAGVLPGEFKLYRCRNNMWDIVTPIIVGGQHVGNIFSGQFFFEDEFPDYEIFRSHARKYGFNEEEYMAALEKVPRLSRETVDTGMTFLTKLAHMLSQLSYSNITMFQALAERDAVVNALRESEKRERARSDELAALLDAVPTAVWVAHDPQALHITGNRLSYEWLRIPEGSNASKSATEGEIPKTFRVFKDGVELLPAEMPLHISAAGTELLDYEFNFVYPDGTMRHLLGNAKPLRDEQGNLHGSISAFIDITERKRVEETLAFERSQLLSIFDGIDDVVYVTDPHTYEVLYANKAMKEKFGGELVGGICYREFQQRDSPCDFCTSPIILKERDKLYHWEYYNPTVDRHFMIMDRIIKWPDGRDVRFEIAKDITERRKAEVALKKAYDDLEGIVEERTAQLEGAYKSLKENEKGLAEAQKMAHIGNWEWDIATDKAYWSEEMYRIFGRDPKKAAPSYNEYLYYIHPDDRDHYCNAIKKAVKGKSSGIDYRIVLANGEERIVHLKSEFVSYNVTVPVRIKGIVQDITERKKAEKALANLETARKKEIHHRIKNNLQVISSLLDLQAEKFRDKEVLKAFRESQNRVLSMSLIHEELYQGEGTDTLNFSEYLRKLAKNLFQTYSLRSKNLHLLMDLEENAFFNMDTAIPLGIIVNELVSNSLKHAFTEGEEGEIRIQLCREENNDKIHESLFSLTISDNGKGIPKNIELGSIESLGLQLVNILIDQLAGNIELKKGPGTEFIISFKAEERL
ncbi:PocR ligand-binding domain-containing protein [Methanosarcina sp.]|uniref:PocR ligand-binding domain-containing protein n=1 Tax=Methanosarcina sp. TaxID=2213 RepID=UPI002ABCC5AC|nr:PocR ligand-binding domain-containing protein [Methanosarcina sp.]MDY9924858.1 PocR ligand-binding domain-containing protein [Methanosarcina sp.]